MKSTLTAAERAAVATSQTVPLWTDVMTSPVDGKTYSSLIVGRNPNNNGHRDTPVPAYVVPVRMKFSDNATYFDPSASDPCIGNRSVVHAVEQSPLFQNTVWGRMNGIDAGATQWADAYQRVNLWPAIADTTYHVSLVYHLLPTLSVSITTGGHTEETGGPCGLMGFVEIEAWDKYVQTTVLPALSSQIHPDGIVIFLFTSVVLYDPLVVESCCILGYHSAVETASGIQTYLTSNFDTSLNLTDAPDISTLSHEVAEWLMNPHTQNKAPAWGHVGQETGCSSEFEVADPLSGTLMPPVAQDGFAYHVQELAFSSWLLRQRPGGVGLYSTKGTFRIDAGALCR
jgi:hypothetical protein